MHVNKYGLVDLLDDPYQSEQNEVNELLIDQHDWARVDPAYQWETVSPQISGIDYSKELEKERMREEREAQAEYQKFTQREMAKQNAEVALARQRQADREIEHEKRQSDAKRWQS